MGGKGKSGSTIRPSSSIGDAAGLLDGGDTLDEDEIKAIEEQLKDIGDLAESAKPGEADWENPKLGEPECGGIRFVGCVKSRMESNKFFVFCQEVSDLSDNKDAKITWKSKPPADLRVGVWIEFTLVREFPEVPLDADWGSPLAIEIEIIERPIGIKLPWEKVEGEWEPPDDGVRFHSLKKCKKRPATGGFEAPIADPVQAQKKALAYRERAAAGYGGNGAGMRVNAYGEPLPDLSYLFGKGKCGKGAADAWRGKAAAAMAAAAAAAWGDAGDGGGWDASDGGGGWGAPPKRPSPSSAPSASIKPSGKDKGKGGYGGVKGWGK